MMNYCITQSEVQAPDSANFIYMRVNITHLANSKIVAQIWTRSQQRRLQGLINCGDLAQLNVDAFI